MQRAHTAGTIGAIATPRRKPRQLRSRETVDNLLEAAAQMFSREGHSATTNRIAERAGVSVGTLYQYFPDKHEMLHALAARHVSTGEQRLTVLFDRLRVQLPSFEQTMTEVLELLVDLHADQPRLHALLHRMVRPRVDELREVQAFEHWICDEVAFHLKRCDRGGDDVEATAQTLVYAIDAQLHRVMTRHGFDIAALMRTVTRLAPPPD